MKTDETPTLHPNEIVLVEDFGQKPTPDYSVLMSIIFNGKQPKLNHLQSEALACQYKRQLQVLFGIETRDPWPKRSH